MKWYRRHWVQLVSVGVLGLIVGSASAGGPSQADLDAAQRREASARADALKARADAEASVADVRAELARKQQALDAREATLTGREAAAKANEIPGDGTFVVGTDVQPGTYRAGPSPSGNCYHARLSSLTSTDIIDNGNTSGPLTIRVLASDKALMLSGCATFRKVG